jgi:YHS domain-containing protein
MKTKFTWLVVALAASMLLPQLTAEEKDPLNGAKCLISGKPAKAESTADYRGAKVYFCCDNCPAAFTKDKAKYSTKANHQLVQTNQAKQEKCPLSGGDLNKEATADVSGVKVAFCCNNCKAKVEKAEGDEKLALVFADKAFDKGFKVSQKK